jgi:hypothetical protein
LGLHGRKEKEEQRKTREALGRGRANSTLTTYSSVILNILS